MRNLVCLLLIFGVVAISTSRVAMAADAPPILKVSVFSSGKTLLDGKLTDLKQLSEAFKAAKSRNGQVWYYRENSSSEAPAQAKAVIKLIVENRLPISFSSKPDFSDYMDREGKSHPRSGVK